MTSTPKPCRWRTILLISAVLMLASPAAAMTITSHVGPPSVGTGGNNPLSIPPVSVAEWEVVILTENNWETSVGIVPGLLVGKRSVVADVFYASAGGGLVISFNDIGLGPYMAFGIDTATGSETIGFNLEYKMALGLGFGGTLVSPNALRLGVSFQL